MQDLASASELHDRLEESHCEMWSTPVHWSMLVDCRRHLFGPAYTPWPANLTCLIITGTTNRHTDLVLISAVQPSEA
jgi:hypothetical protein